MMNNLSNAKWELNKVDSVPRTLTVATRSMAGHAFYSSHWWERLAVALIVLISSGLVEVYSAASQDVPSGTIQLTGGSVAAGIGYTWGKGIVTFEGKQYPIKVDGLSVLHVGASSYSASGTIYNLKNISDINGVYTAVAAGVAVAGGASATAMKNSKGVLIQMASTHLGVNFSLGAKGVTISQYAHSF